MRIKLNHNRYVSRMIVLACSLFLFYSAQVQAQGVADKVTKLGDRANNISSDTTLHKSIKKGSVIPIPIIITEPALGGIGGGLALGYLHSNRNSLRKNTPPTISGVFGGYTANKSWLVGIAHSHSWDNDRIRYLGGIVKGNINLDFYPNILPSETEPRPLDVNLDAWATLQRVTFRMGKSDVWLGPQYIYFGTTNSLNVETDHPLLDSLINEISGKSSLGMLGLMVMWDTRKNTLSPDDGFYTGGKFDYNATFFGGKSNFFQGDIYFKYYFPIGKKVFGGVRMDSQFSSGDVPFYAKPFISLRGVPAMRYQGNSVLVAETQWRWMFYKGISVLGFVGAGQAFEESKEILGQTIGNDEPLVINYGGGLRYTLKKAFGVRVGADVAWANDDFAWYISVGSSF